MIGLSLTSPCFPNFSHSVLQTYQKLPQKLNQNIEWQRKV